MKYVIELPDEYAEALQKSNVFMNGMRGNGKTLMIEIFKAVCNGTVLPKGHGRLIDADALAKDLDYDVELDARALDDMYLVGENRRNTQFDKDCKQNCIWYLSEAPTIIEADKEGE